MKFKEYAKELSLTILGVLIALLIDNYRENVRDRKIVNAYLDIVAEDLNYDIMNLNEQLGWDSVNTRSIKKLNDILSFNQDLPQMKYSLASWRKQDSTGYRKLDKWDSLDHYTRVLYSSSSYKIRHIGFSTIVNSGMSHQIDKDLLKSITIYYTTDSQDLDFFTDIDEKCLWNGIPFSNKYQGYFTHYFDVKDYGVITELRNHVGGRQNTMLNEMNAKRDMLKKAKALLELVKKT